MNIIGIIPARYASTRFEGKPLCRIGGKTMIECTYNQAFKVKEFAEVAVATDDVRIYDAVVSFGGKALMTSPNHRSGTDRCAEAFQQLDYPPENSVVVNIQGDEPFIKPEQIQELIACFSFADVGIATLIKKIETQEMLDNPNVVKVVISNENSALYFSRYPVPFLRNASFEDVDFYRHIGMYAYWANVLEDLVKIPPSPLEKAESLEQLRWLQAGYAIYARQTQYEASIGIDTPQDLEMYSH
ncbi:MAG: 3-deoxy-manno-octulosonate cytidylyltransferase [Lentimicrobiaceae bacterium]|nr:3-deoxy-manno-octulosonate cytidylyltransferase [Lentimicrobiaceae bacterium]